MISFVLLALVAQVAAPEWMATVLPAQSQVVETAMVEAGPARRRALVLWMLHPERRVRGTPMGCTEDTFGDHWRGITRLSLVDLARRRLVNTVEPRRGQRGLDGQEIGVTLPFLTQSGLYVVPSPNARRGGIPKILNLRDLTGEGRADRRRRG